MNEGQWCLLVKSRDLKLYKDPNSNERQKAKGGNIKK